MKISKHDKLDFTIPDDINFKFIEQDIIFNLYNIRYTYKTNRGNKKENHRYLFADDLEDAKFKFINYINDYNKQKPYRTVLNVKILDTELIGTVTK